MHPDLDRVIRLQRLDTFTDTARRAIASLPDRIAALDTRLATAHASLEAARAHLVSGQTARRSAEKDLATAQGRLSKFKDQLMEVKTNREYQAMLKEIEVAQHDVRKYEDVILERMLEADELSAAVKQAETVLTADQTAIDTERRRLEEEVRRYEQELTRIEAERDALAREVPPQLMSTYDLLIRKRGVAVSEARDERCVSCHVRVRPQVFNEIRRNDSIIQCDSCQRILYFNPESAAPAAPAAGA